MGRVMKCDTPERIRDYPVSITDEGLLYKNYVVRALNPKLWAHPAIGQNAIALRLREIASEIAAQKQRTETYIALKTGAKACREIETYSQSGLKNRRESVQGNRNLFAKRRGAAFGYGKTADGL